MLMLMRIKNRTLSIVGIALMLAGCSMPYYRPYNGDAGFSETPIGPGLFEVSYVGTGDQAPSNATYFATLRAAELAHGQNKPHFELITRDRSFTTETNTQYGQTIMDQHFDRRSGRTYGSIYSSPTVTTTTHRPVVVLEVKLLDQPTDRSLSTSQTIRDAIASGIEFGPAVSATYGVPVKK
jgi:hypothetical protein